MNFITAQQYEQEVKDQHPYICYGILNIYKISLNQLSYLFISMAMHIIQYNLLRV